MSIGIVVLAAAAATAVPQVTGPIPVSADSYPFLAAQRVQQVVDLPARAYVEEEFIVRGTANVYNWAADGSLSAKTPNVPYATRILVRRPADRARFSGTVIVEPLNNARAYDWAFLWAYSYEYFIEHGDAWVGVTHLPAAIAALKKFNPRRYESLAMANPNPSEACGRGNTTSDSEEGLRWDMFSQVGALLKSHSSNRPLAGFTVDRVYASSHFAELATYVNAVHASARLENGRPVYDGYLIKANEDPGRINRCAAAPAEGDPRQITKHVDVPVIRMVAQGDVLETFTRRRPDSDEPADRYRLYEVAGAPHMDKIFYRHMPVVADQIAAGQVGFLAEWPLAYACDPAIALMDLPIMRYATNAAFANLDRWVRTGVPPPRAESIGVKNGGTSQASFVTDQVGNVVGGVRSPYLDVPIATYSPSSTGPQTCRNLGHKVPLDWSKLEAMYGSANAYASKVAESVDRLVKEHWLTAFDGRRITAELIPR